MIPQSSLFQSEKDVMILDHANLEYGKSMIKKHHYTHSIPSGKSYYFGFDGAIVVYSIPANPYVSQSLFSFDAVVWELTRLWAPDGHEPNLLTQAISKSVKIMCRMVDGLDALISYADPNVGHKGGVYRAASWVFVGQSSEGRYYTNQDGQVVARRKFHSGSKSMKKSEIIALGYTELYLPGKYRFVRPLSRNAKREIAKLKMQP